MSIPKRDRLNVCWGYSKPLTVSVLVVYLIVDIGGSVFFALGLAARGRGVATMEAAKYDYFEEYKRGTISTDDYE